MKHDKHSGVELQPEKPDQTEKKHNKNLSQLKKVHSHTKDLESTDTSHNDLFWNKMGVDTSQNTTHVYPSTHTTLFATTWWSKELPKTLQNTNNSRVTWSWFLTPSTKRNFGAWVFSFPFFVLFCFGCPNKFFLFCWVSVFVQQINKNGRNSFGPQKKDLFLRFFSIFVTLPKDSGLSSVHHNDTRTMTLVQSCSLPHNSVLKREKTSLFSSHSNFDSCKFEQTHPRETNSIFSLVLGVEPNQCCSRRSHITSSKHAHFLFVAVVVGSVEFVINKNKQSNDHLRVLINWPILANLFTCENAKQKSVNCFVSTWCFCWKCCAWAWECCVLGVCGAWELFGDWTWLWLVWTLLTSFWISKDSTKPMLALETNNYIFACLGFKNCHKEKVFEKWSISWHKFAAFLPQRWNVVLRTLFAHSSSTRDKIVFENDAWYRAKNNLFWVIAANRPIIFFWLVCFLHTKPPKKRTI